MEEKVRDYAVDEGILGKSLPADEKLEFGYELNYPPGHPHPMKILALKMKDRKALAFQLATQIAPQHIELLKKIPNDGLGLFFNIFKKQMLATNCLYNIDFQNHRYIISETIYPDGLTEDHFYRIIRKIFDASLLINTILMELIGGKLIDGKGGKIEEIPYNGGSSMYT